MRSGFSVTFLRKLYSLCRRARLRSRPSLISRDCVGGVLCSDLGMEFSSPTVNLFIPEEEFLLFCRHLEAFLSAEPEEVPEHGESYPVGRLATEFGTVTLHLMHYASFSEAAQAWERRKRRVDFDNLRIIFHTPPGLPEALAEQFEQLPFDHKVLLSGGIDTAKYPHCRNLPCYAEGCREPVTYYPSPSSIKRWQDEFDWVPFLNGGLLSEKKNGIFQGKLFFDSLLRKKKE